MGRGGQAKPRGRPHVSPELLLTVAKQADERGQFFNLRVERSALSLSLPLPPLYLSLSLSLSRSRSLALSLSLSLAVRRPRGPHTRPPAATPR
jgi:hypothetical protein